MISLILANVWRRRARTLLTATGMYLFGAPRDEAPALGLGTDGTSAILYGRWP